MIALLMVNIYELELFVFEKCTEDFSKDKN